MRAAPTRAATVSTSPDSISTENMAPSLQQCMDDLVEIFHSYSKTLGNKYKLNYTELSRLINKELTAYLGSNRNPRRVSDIMAKMDKDKDGQVDFKEFIVIVADLTVACNNFFVQTDQILG